MASESGSRARHRVRIERGSDSGEQASGVSGGGLCECGCGQRTRLAPQTAVSKGWIRGEPLRFIRGHANRTKQRPPLDESDYTVEDRGYKTPCWIRIGFTTSTGYGKVAVAGRQMYAHRVMYEQKVGPIPEGMELDHLCRQTKCIRPDHLEPVTRAINLRRGNGAKLTVEDVRAIRAAPSTKSTKSLAECYGLSESQMSRVRRGLSWQ